jgi:SRSO17 transposase
VGRLLPQQVRSVLSAWLTPLSKPQQPQLLIYLAGLLWIIRFRSLREIAARFGGAHLDRLHHFVSCSTPCARDLQHQTQRLLARQAPGGSEPLLVLDDTPCARNGPAIEGLGVHHSAKGLVRGWCAVTAMLKVGSRRFLWAVRGYRPKKNCPRGQFRSKIEWAVEIVHEATEYFPRGGLTVLMDSWYACARLLVTIQEAGWRYVAAVRSNRLVVLPGSKRKVSVRSLAKSRRGWRTVRAGKKRRYRVRRVRAWLPQVGEVLVFVVQHGGALRGFVTNDLSLSEAQMVRVYGQRFWIETLHRELKQYLGFGELFVRKWAAAERHWTMAGLAYNLVVLWNGKRRRSFRAMLRAFRDAVDPDELIQLHQHLIKAR